MIFIHEYFPGQDEAGNMVPISLIRELLIGPDQSIWQGSIAYALQQRKQGCWSEVGRVLSMTIHAHARYHLNIPHHLVSKVNAAVLTKVMDTLDELAELHPTLLFYTMEKLICAHEPYRPCLNPQSDGYHDIEAASRFDQDM